MTISKSPKTRALAPRHDLATQEPAIAAHLAEIRRLTDSLRDQKNQLRENLLSAAETGHQLGGALNSAKGQFDTQTFGLLLDQAGLEKGDADRWMQFEFSFDAAEFREPLGQRQAFLALGVMPDKPEIEHAGDLAVSLPPLRTSDLSLAFGRLKRQLALGRGALDVLKAIADTDELYEWLTQLRTKTIDV